MNPKALLLACLALPALAMAGVNPKNGNFYISYQDITQQAGGHELNLVRTYNSLSSEVGWFGAGWGSRFETRLIAMPDGSAVVRENGTGQSSYYRPAAGAHIAGGVARIVGAAVRRDGISAAQADALRQALEGDEELRMRKVLQYGLHGEMPAGTVLRADDCAAGALARVAAGYQRTACDRSRDLFDLQGRMTGHEESDGYRVRLDYDGQYPGTIRDTLGQSIVPSWTAAGRVAAIKTGGEQHVRYTYGPGQDLLSSSELNGPRYDYEYDGNHNLVRIAYIDKSSMRIEYIPPERGLVGSVTGRGGEQTLYSYRKDPLDPRHTFTTVTTVTPEGGRTSREYEYQSRTTETGAEQVARFAAGNGANRAETLFDAKGRVIRKAGSAGEPVEYVYDTRSDKLVLVLSGTTRTEFHYDAQGNLTRAAESTGREIELEYGANQRIDRIIDLNRADGERRELRFRYNAAGKPVEIHLVGTGRITVAYDGQGEITKVESDQGMRTALQVTQVFQNLLGVVRVAGVRLDM